MTLRSYAFSHCSATGAPCVRPCASKSDCFKYTLFDGPASASGLGRGASSSAGLRSRRSPRNRTAASCHGQTCTLMTSSRLVHLHDTNLLNCPSKCRFAIRNQNVLAGLHPETDEYAGFHPVFGLRSICQQTLSIPHSSPNTHLHMWCPRPRHRSNGTFSSDPTFSRFSNVACAKKSKQWSLIPVVFASGSCSQVHF